MASNDPSAIQKVVRIVDTQIPAMPHGCTYGRWTCGCEYRSFRAAGKIHRYESSVVDMAMSRTTVNAFAVLWCFKSSIAVMQKMLDAIPDMTFTRTGVPSFLLNTPKNGKNAPSY